MMHIVTVAGVPIYRDTLETLIRLHGERAGYVAYLYDLAATWAWVAPKGKGWGGL